MTPKEKETVKAFMRMMLRHIHPNFHEYPIEHLKSIEHSQGEGFEGTEYAGTYLEEAFYMNQHIENL